MRRVVLVFVVVMLALALALTVSADCGWKCGALHALRPWPLQNALTLTLTPTPQNGGHAPFEEPPFYLPYTPTPPP